jgi:putative solute:sodium symporter small subunit
MGQKDEDLARARAYWRANLKLSAVLLIIWFVVSFGFGIILVDTLNRIPLFGFKLGFWWAQQGSIYVFIVLIFVYAAAMKRLDRKYDVHEHAPRNDRE